jgi:hypothetical protein
MKAVRAGSAMSRSGCAVLNQSKRRVEPRAKDSQRFTSAISFGVEQAWWFTGVACAGNGDIKILCRCRKEELHRGPITLGFVGSILAAGSGGRQKSAPRAHSRPGIGRRPHALTVSRP